MLGHVQLKEYYLESLIIEVNPEWLKWDQEEPDSAASYAITPEFDVWEADPNVFIVELSIRCVPADENTLARFTRISVAARGLFVLSEDAPDERRAELAWYNPVLMLHGIARGTILHATGSCTGGQFLLPAVNYAELIQAKLEEVVE